MDSGRNVRRAPILMLALSALLLLIALSLRPLLPRDLTMIVIVAAIVLLLFVVSFLTFRSSLQRIEAAQRHVARVDRLYLSTIETLATAIDAKDEAAHGHIRRIQAAALQLARALGINDEPTLKALEAAALLHDTGKLAVPEHILNKPGKLTEAEFERIKRHPSVGADILASVDFPYPVVPIVRHHHENWDGSGYPDGLKEADIPIGARILSVVDCFDALTSDRPYRKKLTDDEAIVILLDRRGTMYDPAVVDAFTGIRAQGFAQPPPLAHTPLRGAAASADAPAPAPAAPVAVAPDERADDVLALRTLASVLTPDVTAVDTLVIAAAHLRAMFPASIVAIYAIDHDRDEVVLRYAWGHGSEGIVGHRLPTAAGLSGWVAVNRQPIVNSDAALDLGERIKVTSPPLATCLSLPLIEGERVVGVLTLYSQKADAYTTQHGRVASQIASAVTALFEPYLTNTATVAGDDWPKKSPTRQTIH